MAYMREEFERRAKACGIEILPRVKQGNEVEYRWRSKSGGIILLTVNEGYPENSTYILKLFFAGFDDIEENVTRVYGLGCRELVMALRVVLQVGDAWKACDDEALCIS